MQVRDFMIEDVISVKDTDTVRHLLSKLVIHKIGGAPVIDESGKLVGTVSDGDVLRSLTPHSEPSFFDLYMMVVMYQKKELAATIEQMMDEPVKHIMNRRKIYTVYPEDPFEQVLKILSRHHFKKIPVIDKENKVVGVISRGDVIRFITKRISGKE
ncbi:MAG: CBS domain-containing protein [Tuberibacillus sp.]